MDAIRSKSAPMTWADEVILLFYPAQRATQVRTYRRKHFWSAACCRKYINAALRHGAAPAVDSLHVDRACGRRIQRPELFNLSYVGPGHLLRLPPQGKRCKADQRNRQRRADEPSNGCQRETEERSPILSMGGHLVNCSTGRHVPSSSSVRGQTRRTLSNGRRNLLPDPVRTLLAL